MLLVIRIYCCQRDQKNSNISNAIDYTSLSPRFIRSQRLLFVIVMPDRYSCWTMLELRDRLNLCQVNQSTSTFPVAQSTPFPAISSLLALPRATRWIGKFNLIPSPSPNCVFESRWVSLIRHPRSTTLVERTTACNYLNYFELSRFSLRKLESSSSDVSLHQIL